jgi:cysteine-rich repeat protein
MLKVRTNLSAKTAVVAVTVFLASCGGASENADDQPIADATGDRSADTGPARDAGHDSTSERETSAVTDASAGSIDSEAAAEAGAQGADAVSEDADAAVGADVKADQGDVQPDGSINSSDGAAPGEAGDQADSSAEALADAPADEAAVDQATPDVAMDVLNVDAHGPDADATVNIADAETKDAASDEGGDQTEVDGSDAGSDAPVDSNGAAETSGEASTPACGNSVREGSEQCDDGNLANLDGCSSSCAFEQIQRMNWMNMMFTADEVCTKNALGGAIGSVGQGALQIAIAQGIGDGSISNMLQFGSLDDLTGTDDDAVTVGFLRGTPVSQGAAPYDGASDLDWWYTTDPLSYDTDRNPTSSMVGSIAGRVLHVSSARLTLNTLFAGTLVALPMSNVTIVAPISDSSAPLASQGLPPGHLTSEHLDPALVSFATMGQPDQDGAAQICGNASAASLALLLIPGGFVGLACAQNYTPSNSLLDLWIGGCTNLGIQLVKSTQPDQVDLAAPAAGAGGPYKLGTNAQRQVSTCRDKNNDIVSLKECLQAATYSSSFKFTTDRVIAK